MRVLLNSLLSACFALPLAAAGHHSMAEYDRSNVTELEGEVAAVSWRNPHILLDVATTDASGRKVVWNVEGGAVSAQRRRGVEGGLVQVGDRVRIAGWPSIRRPLHMLVNHVLMPDGVELLVGSVREPRWSESSVGSQSNLVDADRAAVASGEGIFRVWSQGTRAWFFEGRASYELTPQAAAAQASYDEFTENPLLTCTPPGMPALMGNPYPMQFVDRGSHLELRFEEFDALRTIHIEDAVDPTSVSATPLGYSIGRWEGETLVVRTTRIDWPYFNRIGAPQTEAVVVDERIAAVDNGNRLDYVMTVTEPGTLVEPFVWEAFWTWRPGEEVGLYDCVVNP